MLIWIGVSLATALFQLSLGTGLPFVVVSLAIFLLLPVPFRILRASDSAGCFLFIATMGKLFIVSQWIKILLLQPADTHLAEPVETALALLVGLAAFAVAAAMLYPVLPSLRVRVLRPSDDPEFLVRFGWFVFGLSLLGFAMRLWLSVGSVEADEAPTGRGRVVWSYLGHLMPLAVAVFTARRIILSPGRRPIDLPVAFVILACCVAGLMTNTRTFMVSGLLAFAVTYLCYGGGIRPVHLLFLVAGGIVMQFYIFPVVDAQRGLSPSLPLLDYLTETLRIVAAVFDRETWEASYERDWLIGAESFVTRLYYGSPFGLLERFTPNQVDEVVAYVVDTGTFGVEYVLYPFSRLLPNLATAMLDWERPLSGAELLQTTIFSTDNFSSPNYGLFAELYAYVGLSGVLLAGAPVLFAYLLALHLVYGGFRNNYLAAFCISTYLFTIADMDMGSMVGQTLEQSVVYGIVGAVARILFDHGGLFPARIRHRPAS